MSKTLACVLAFVTALSVPLAANALGLGEIKLNSALNQNLNADIQIVGAASDELDSLQVKLASQAQFQQAGLDYPSVLVKLQFQVVRKTDGTAYLHVTSPDPIREPFLDFLIDANWDNGELLREYTVLLNPPNFETASKAAPAPVKPAAPAQSPTAALIAPETPKQAAPTEAAPAPVVPAPVETTPMAAQPAPTPAPTPISPAPSAPGLGSDYGPIHRGETLSEIASQLRPSGVTLNQMMIAIYRANPEIFMHNINRMKAGYVMRIPNLSDVQAITVSEANSEVRTQIQEWRASRGLAEKKPAKSESGTTPALELVAPSSAAEASENQVPGGAESGTGAMAESTPAKTGKPEKSIEPSEPAEAAPAKPGEVAASTPPPLPPALPSAATHTEAPVAVKSNAMAAAEQQASNLNKQPENKGMPLPAEKPPVTTPLPTQKQPAKPAAESGGIVDTLIGVLTNIYVLGIVGLVVILVLIGVIIKKRRGGATSKKPKSLRPGRISGADWLEQEQSGVEDLAAVTTRTKTKQAKNKGAAPAQEEAEESSASESGSADKTVLAAPPSSAGTDTIIADTAPVKLDDSDPVSEADFHMAYGLYDQAADVLKKALEQNPGRRDATMKLLEVYFTAGDSANFVKVARGLHNEIGATPDKDWENVAIMGRQVAPNESLFSSTAGEGGIGTSSSVDIALDGGGTDTMVSDLDPLAGAFESTGDVPHAGTEILSGTHMLSEPASAGAKEPAAEMPSEENSLEFSLPDVEPETPAEPVAKASAPAAESEGGMDFDLGDINIEPTPSEPKPESASASASASEGTAISTDFGTDSQVEFDKALKELSDFVNTNVPPQEEEAPADGGLGAGLSLDGEMPSMTASATPAEDTGANSLSEVGTKLDLARAYIDMGDPDGAKSILDEVMEEGTAQQKQEAQELMQHLG